jgi:hypothetical protein
MSETVVQQDNVRSVHDAKVRQPRPWEIIKNLALEACQLLFLEPDNPMGYRWDPDEGKTQIVIVDKHSFNLERVGTKPAIVASRGPILFLKTSGFQQLQSLDMRTDTRTYTDLARGGVILSCFSEAGLEAEDLAGFVLQSFQAFRHVLRKIGRQGIMVPNHLGFFKIEATNMGEEALVKSDSRPSLSVVPVAIQAHVQRRWSVTPRSARKLNQVVIRTSSGGTH